MIIEELNLSANLYAKLKRFGCNYTNEIPNFPLKKLNKSEIIEFFSVFFEILSNYEQNHEDDQVLIAQMSKELEELKKNE